MAGIDRNRAKAILDDFGGDKEGFKPVESLSLLEQLAAVFALAAADKLNEVDRISSGNLKESIKPVPIQIKGRTLIAEVSVDDYYKFVNSGVAGTQKGNSNEGFKFKNDKPSKKMVQSIYDWLVHEGLTVTDPSKNKVAISSRESKRQANPDSATRSKAYLTARKIKREGIEPTGFWTDTVELLRKEINEKMPGALKIDVIETIRNATI